MVGYGSGTQRVAFLEPGVTGFIVRYMDVGAVGKVGSKLKDGWWAEVFAEVDDVLRGGGRGNDDFALSYEERDLVFGLGREVAELDAGDYGVCRRC